MNWRQRKVPPTIRRPRMSRMVKRMGGARDGGLNSTGLARMDVMLVGEKKRDNPSCS